RRPGHLAVSGDHAGVGLSLHLARAPHHRRAGAKRMTHSHTQSESTVARRSRSAVGVALVLYVLSGFPGAGAVAGVSREVPGARGRQAVVETTAGTFVIDLAPDAAPNQTAHFLKLAADGTYDGTIFHRAVKYGMVQGGDPISKDPSKRALYGTG